MAKPLNQKYEETHMYQDLVDDTFIKELEIKMGPTDTSVQKLKLVK
tara:strand:+ start:119 stop:256 length:138 start_codon:yes stop_codon:yes gene_type:complete